MKKVLLLLLCVTQVQAVTFTVVNTNNSGVGSLLQAILDANANGGNCTIDFNIPGVGPHIIAPTAFYSTSPNRIYPPFVNDGIILDATTQAGFVLGNPSVRIDCNAIAGTGSCLAIVGADNCVIKGIGVERMVTGGSGRGISIESTVAKGADGNQVLQCRLGSFAGFGNTRGLVISGAIGAPAPITNTLVDGNVLSGNSISGLQMDFNVQDSIIQNNFIGCNQGGTVAVGNAFGIVFIGGIGEPDSGNVVQNNVISGNSVYGIIMQALVQNNTIQNNKIGVNATGSATLGATQYGIVVVGISGEPADSNIMDSNIIGGCTQNGIYIVDNASDNSVTNNFIGTNALGTNLGNNASGVRIEGDASGPCERNFLENNTIQFNGFVVGGDEYGILITGNATTPDILNAMLANNISGNKDNGIKLQDNANHTQAAPTVTSAGVCLGQEALTISATAPNAPLGAQFRLDFFVNTVDRNPITEGERYIGSVSPVATGQTVTETFFVPAPFVVEGNFVSATATNLNNAGGPGDTSEYSLNTTVTVFNPPTITSFTATPNPVCYGSPTTVSLIFTPGTSTEITATWSDGLMQTGVTSPLQRVFTPLANTSYDVTLTDTLSCTAASATVLVTVNPLPFVSVTASTHNILIGESVTLTATPSGNGPFNLFWSDGFTQLGVVGVVQRVVSPVVSTDYRVIVVDANGCQFEPAEGTVIVVGRASPLVLAMLAKGCTV